jgi:hypothetical protein
MTYSLAFQRKIFALKSERGLTFLETFRLFNISIATLFRWCLKIEPQKTPDKPATKIDMEALKKDVEDYPDTYHYKRAKRLNVAQRTVGYALKRLGVTYKKNAKTSQGRSRKTFCLLSRN